MEEKMYTPGQANAIHIYTAQVTSHTIPSKKQCNQGGVQINTHNKIHIRLDGRLKNQKPAIFFLARCQFLICLGQRDSFGCSALPYYFYYINCLTAISASPNILHKIIQHICQEVIILKYSKLYCSHIPRVTTNPCFQFYRHTIVLYW